VITIPTLVGTAEIVSSSIALTTTGNRQIALIR
jgi:hypothetical protein